jgi:hypothetical protein
MADRKRIDGRKARRHIRIMVSILKKLNFDLATPPFVAKIWKRLEIGEPDIPQNMIEERKNQLSFVKEKEGYLIWVRTSIDPSRKNFNRFGRIWITISKPTDEGEKRLYTTFFYRRGEFSTRFEHQLIFVNNAVTTRPLDSNNQRMELKESESTPGIYRWYSVSNPEENEDFFTHVPKQLGDTISKRESQKQYYQKITRPHKGITKRARDSKKPWIVKNPKNAMS